MSSGGPAVGPIQAAIVPPAATPATNAAPFGYTTQVQADAIVTELRALQVELQALRLTL